MITRRRFLVGAVAAGFGALAMSRALLSSARTAILGTPPSTGAPAPRSALIPPVRGPRRGGGASVRPTTPGTAPPVDRAANARDGPGRRGPEPRRH